MHILVTNDDGVHAPGLLALVNAARPFGKVTVLAPDHNWSVSGHVKTLHRPLRVNRVNLADGSPALTTDGAPSDCVSLVSLGILDEPVDLVLSGINSNANLGHDLTYSGTVTAAMEAAIWGIKGMAFSLEAHHRKGEALDYAAASRIAHSVLDTYLLHDFPADILLNVNIPSLPFEEIKGFMITRQGQRIYHDALVRREDPMGQPYYWIGGDAPTGVPDNGTDIGALNQGYVSISPIQLDLTAYDRITELKNWGWSKE